MRRATAFILGTLTGTALLVGAKVGTTSAASGGVATSNVILPGAGTASAPAPSRSRQSGTKSPAPSHSPKSIGKGSTPTPTKSATPTQAPKRYADGTYKASSSERYGTVTLTVTIAGGKITGVGTAYTGGGESQRISDNAWPRLRSETLAAQSASISTVSGATYTSKAYTAALAAILSSAKN